MVRWLFVLAVVALPAAGDELNVSAIVKTIRFHPTGEPARVGLQVLSRRGPPGWKALASLTAQLLAPHPDVARAAAHALAEGPEPERLVLAARSYKRLEDPGIRAILAVGLAYGYADHETLLRKHLRENRRGAPAVLEVLAPKILPEQELRRCLETPDLAPIAYAALRARQLTVQARELLPWARTIAVAALDPERCRRWARRRDFLIFEAVALALDTRDDDRRDGAHCLLLTLAGKRLPADADIWRSWIAAHKDRYTPPPALSPGHIAAAVVRGARFLRHDLLADGKSVWSAEPNGGATAIGATGLAVLALRSAGYPATHPAIERALRTTLLVFGPGDAPALPALENRARETYILAVLTLALCDIDAKKFRVPLDALRRRLVVGMQKHGQWAYQCLTPTDSMGAGRTDNSITQYAVLALRALAKAGFRIEPETWQAIAMHLYRSVNQSGGWNYTRGNGGPQVSMTSAGISSLAICHEALGGRHAAERIQADAVLKRARAYLGRLLMEHDYTDAEPYAYYGVERALALTATKGFRSKHRTYDWYRRGARRLLDTQDRAGHWGYPERRAIVGHSYGRAIDTAYAILFLTKATATIGSGETATLEVELPPEKDKPEPPAPPPPPRTEPPPAPPELEPELAVVPTRTGEAVIRGRTTGVALTIDGRPAPVDARGRFAIPVTVSGPQTFLLVARGENGLLATRRVGVAFDTELPRVARMGPPQRHVGKQVLIFRADEPLRSLQVAGRVYPADGPIVRAAVEVGEGKRVLTVIATDRAGNESRSKIGIEAVNRVLVLDGQSAVGVDLRERPARFTVECWVRGDAPTRPAAVVANTESSGYALFWRWQNHALPFALVRAGGRYLAVDPKRGWNWAAWTHLALSYDGEKLRYFVNGSLQGEDRGGPYTASNHRLFIGAQPTGHSEPYEFFTGAIDEVRVSKVARYVEDFRPERNFMRDRATLLLLHFDRQTVAEGVLLDDSGMHHLGTVYGTPVQERAAPAPSVSVLAHAREELRGELPPLDLPELTAAQHAAQNARAREAARSLHLLTVTVRVTSAQNVVLPGIAVRALHETFDIAAGPAVTDGRGEAVLRLPSGPWRLDLVTHEPQAGRIVFARVRRPVRAAGEEEIALDRRRQVRFRSRLGEARAAHVVTLAWPDFSFFKRVDVRQGQFDVFTVGDAPMVVQAVRRPGEEGDGYVFRQSVGEETTIVETDPEQGTLHTFSGKGVRTLAVRYGSADALPIPLAFQAKETRRVLLAGLSHCVVGYDIDLGGRGYGFLPRPFQVDGQPRTFLGKPPFEASVGYVHNGRPRYRDRQNTGNLRIFLKTPNGMLLKFDPQGIYSVAWEQVLHGQVLAAGTVKPPQRVRTAVVDPKEIGNLRYRLRIRGPGENRRVEVAAHGQSAVVQVGKVRIWCFPEVEPNARMWVACVDRAVRAYEQTCPNRRPRTDIERSIEMPPGLAGMGGWMGDGNGWMWLPEGSVYGFVGQWYWTGLLCHELGHVHGYGHGNPTQTRIMRQAGRRAGRRLWALRPGMERVPEGNRFVPLLDAVTRGDLQVQQDLDDARDIPVLRKTGEGHAVGDGILVPNLEITGDDAVFMWYYRATYGEEVDAARRRNAAAWSWWLTRKGFSDPEIQIALFSHAAGTSLAWLARLRGNMVYDHRLDAALEELKANEGKFVDQRTRDAIVHRWRTKRYADVDDLVQEARVMHEEIGHRWVRFDVLRTLAREHFARREMAAGERMLVAALVEARLGGEGMLESALEQSAALWAAR